MTGEQYIELAKSQFNTREEAYIRCAISRYYYGLLHLAINKLIELNSDEYDILKINLKSPPDDKSYSIHSSTIRAVNEINPVISGELHIVRELRVLSDYKFDISVLTPIKVKINTKKENYQNFTDEKEILIFLEGVFSKISTLKGTPKDRGPKFGADISGLLKLKNELAQKRK